MFSAFCNHRSQQHTGGKNSTKSTLGRSIRMLRWVSIRSRDNPSGTQSYRTLALFCVTGNVQSYVLHSHWQIPSRYKPTAKNPQDCHRCIFFWSISSPLVDVKSVVLVVYPLSKIWPPF